MTVPRFIKSRLLGDAIHGFFGRTGGVSGGGFESLNCRMGGGDPQAHVTTNRQRAVRALGLKDGNLAVARQTHSTRALAVSAPFCSDPPEADGLVTKTPGLAVGVLTADCLPVLLEDRVAGVVGAAHGGWKGTLAGILQETVDAMLALGARRRRIRAAIGPSISQRAYEVGPEYRAVFIESNTDNSRFFVPGAGEKFWFDLPAFGIHQLVQAGVADAAWTGHCTFSEPENYFSYRRSYRRNELSYGCQISMISPRTLP